MKCIICDKQIKQTTCPYCNYINNEQSLFNKLIHKKPLPYNEQIKQIFTFYTFIKELKEYKLYYSKKMVKEVIDKQLSTYNFFSNLKENKELKGYLKRYNVKSENIEYYLDFIKDIDHQIDNFNNEFIKRILKKEKTYFDHILKDLDPNITLDEEQRIAIVTDEDYELMIAGAGSGKTTTIIAKIKYLVDFLHIDPKDILVISFTNQTVKELKQKINNKLKINAPIATFHQTGRAITNKEESTKATNILPYSYNVIKDFLKNHISKDQDLLKKLILLFGYYLDFDEELLTKCSLEDLFYYKQKASFHTLKSELEEVKTTYVNAYNKCETINDEQLKSKQEVQIANFLYLNNIEYIYEPTYPFKIPHANKVYTPDFLIKQGDNEFYLEHFGISEDLKNSRYTEEELANYIKIMHDKISIHQEHHTNLIYTFSSYNDKRTLIEHLTEQLKEKGFILTPKKDEEVYEKLKNKKEDNYFNRFAYLVNNFLHNFKVKDYNESDFANLKLKYPDPRSTLFLDVMHRIYLYYQTYLKEHDAVDFEDMINESTRILKEFKDMKQKLNFKYIIVDEYQDISRQRFNLLKELSKVTEAKITAVGDDWQAIYAFSGAEINLFTKFSEEFGYAKVVQLTKTYRNAQELIDIAGGFIQKNKEQIKKSLKSDKKIKKPIVIYTYNDDTYIKDEEGKNIGYIGVMKQKAQLITEVIKKIVEVDSLKQNILLIGRYGFDMDKLCDTGLFVKKLNRKEEYYIATQYPNIHITFLTAHSSKGLTYDNVIVLNNEDGKFGFPTQIEDDSVIKMVTTIDKSYEYAEERRLFYVALTRTKNRVFLITPEKRPSKFVLELINDYSITVHGTIDKNYQRRKNHTSCPRCNYPLVLRKNKTYGLKLYMCTNEPEVCGFLTNDLRGDEKGIHFCPKCSGYMIVKNKEGKSFFYGCTNYSDKRIKCTNTEQITRSSK